MGESRTFTWNGAIFQGHHQSHRTETHLGEVFTERGKVFTEHEKEGSQPITTSRDKTGKINMGPYSLTQADLMAMPMLSTILIEYRQLVASVTMHLGILSHKERRGGMMVQRETQLRLSLCTSKRITF